MGKFIVHVTESYSKNYIVEAESADKAKEIVNESMNYDDEFCPVADSDAWYDRKISVESY